MKKPIFVLFLLLTQIAIAVETCDYAGDFDAYTDNEEVLAEDMSKSNQPIDAEEKWMIDLNKYLMNHHDINVAIKGLNALSVDLNRVNPETQLPVIDTKDITVLLDNVSVSNNANFTTLMTALNLCDTTELAELCSAELIKDQLFEMAPENINIYLNDLAQAVEDEDAETIDLIIERMSKAKYSQMLNQGTPEFNLALDSYLMDNPYPINFNDSIYQELGIDDSDIKIEEINRQFLKIGYNMVGLSSYTQLAPLSKACQSFQAKPDQCLVIAKTLQSNSDTSLMTMLGYNLAVSIYEQMGDEIAYEKSKAESEEYTTYYRCLFVNQTEVQAMDYLTDSTMLKLMNNHNHEGRSIEAAAVYLYEKYQKAGYENLVDPKTCGLRYVN